MALGPQPQLGKQALLIGMLGRANNSSDGRAAAGALVTTQQRSLVCSEQGLRQMDPSCNGSLEPSCTDGKVAELGGQDRGWPGDPNSVSVNSYSGLVDETQETGEPAGRA